MTLVKKKKKRELIRLRDRDTFFPPNHDIPMALLIQPRWKETFEAML